MLLNVISKVSGISQTKAIGFRCEEEGGKRGENIFGKVVGLNR